MLGEADKCRAVFTNTGFAVIGPQRGSLFLWRSVAFIYSGENRTENWFCCYPYFSVQNRITVRFRLEYALNW